MTTGSDFNIYDWFDSHAEARDGFLSRTGWADATVMPVSEDCAMRRYLRLMKGGKSVILLESLPDTHPNATPGHRVSDFARIGGYLQKCGLHTPEIYEGEPDEGLLLIEDFGDVTFKKALSGGIPRSAMYGLATDVLIHMRDHVAGDVKDGGIELPHYHDSIIHRDRRHVIDWYLPSITGREADEDTARDYLAVWDGIEQGLPKPREGVLHIDFHFENLIWMPQESGLARCGILDFQQAMTGPLAYDLANLLGDARISVGDDIRKSMTGRYCAGMSAEERENFESWLTVLMAQFHCRVIGLFVRMKVRDHKDAYLKHIPRVAAYLENELADPVLKPLKDWFDGHDISFAKIPAIAA